MATSFESLKLAQPGLFGVRLTGSVGRSEKNRLKELAAKCLANGKLRVVFDMSSLEAIGGGGAAVLAEFQRDLAEKGGEAVFAAPSEVVQKFLALQFGNLPFRCFPDIDVAAAALAAQGETGGATGGPSAGAAADAAAGKPAGAGAAVKGTAQATPAARRAADAGAAAVPAPDAPDKGSARKGKGTPAAEAGAPDPAHGAPPGRGRADSSLDELLGGFSSADGSAQPRPHPEGPGLDPALVPEARRPAPAGGREPEQSPGTESPRGRTAIPSASPAPAGSSGAVRPQYISFENALVVLRNVTDVTAMVEPLRNLLHSFDLAREVTIFLRQGDRFVAADGPGELAVNGPLATALAAVARPLSLLDMGDLELADAEARLLAELRADMALPIRRHDLLQAVAFVRRGIDGQEYGVAETFGLTVLGQLLSELAARGTGRDGVPGGARGGPEGREGSAGRGAARAGPAGAGDDARGEDGAPAPDAEAGAARADLPGELRRKIVQMQVLFSISEEFSRVRDAARLMDLLCVTVTSQLGVRAVAILELDGETLTPRICRGLDLERIPRLSPVNSQMQAWLVEQPLPAPVAELPPLLHRFQDLLAEAGFAFVAPLKTRGQLLGIVLLGAALNGTRPELDLDFLSTLLNQAAIAMDNTRMLQQAQDQNIGVIRTLVSLIEQRSLADGDLTERIANLVGDVARELNFPPEKLRDLTYGTVLRDIGMIPISDLVLRSPRKLTEAEWRQIKAHPEVGVQLLAPLQLPTLVKDVVLNHHERFNGEGYPRGIQGRAIPLGARIVSVVESYVAMISDLPYRTALSPAEAIAILNENWGLRYDPEIVEAFLRVLAQEDRTCRAQPSLVGAGTPGGGS